MTLKLHMTITSRRIKNKKVNTHRTKNNEHSHKKNNFTRLGTGLVCTSYIYHTINRAAFVCLSVCSLSPPRSFDQSSPNLVGVCRWTSELPLRGSFSKRSTGRRVNGSLSLSTILYICQPHSTQLQKATLLLQHLIRLKGTFCCIDGWWVYLGGSRNCLLDGSSMACSHKVQTI